MSAPFVQGWRVWGLSYSALVLRVSEFANSRIMIHQPLGGAQGQATDINWRRKSFTTSGSLNEYLAEHTGQPLERIELDTERDFFHVAR